MLVDRALPAVGVGDALVREGEVPGLPDKLHHRGDQPEGVVRAGVLQAVDDPAPVRRGHHRGGLEGRTLLLRLEPAGLEEMQAVALRRQGAQQLDEAAAAFVRVGVGHHHGVLGRVPVAQAHTPAHLDEGGEAGKHHVDLALVQVPDVQLRVHALVGGGDLQAAELPVPERRQTAEVLVGARLSVLLPHGPAGLEAALAQQEEQPRLLPRGQAQTLFQAAAVVAALLKAAGAGPALHGQGVALGPVGAEEAVPQAVKTVGLKIGGEELIAVLLVIEVVLDDAVGIAAARGVEAHLEVSVVHVHLVEAELQIGKDGQASGPSAGVSQAQIPDLHRVVHGDKEGLGGLDAAVIALIAHIAQAVAAGEMLLRLAHRLPGDAPVVAALLVPQVEIVARAVHGHAVGPETGDAVVLRALIDQIAPGRVVEHAHHVPGADVVGPAHGQIHPVDHIFPICVVKMAVLHSQRPFPYSSIRESGTLGKG